MADLTHPTISFDEDDESEDDEEERAEKRVKLTEGTQALGKQVAALQVTSCPLFLVCSNKTMLLL